MAQQLQPFVPVQFKSLFNWLKQRRGLDLFSRVNFTEGFCVAGIEFTPEDAKLLRQLLDNGKAQRRPQNKHPAKARDSTDLLSDAQEPETV